MSDDNDKTRFQPQAPAAAPGPADRTVMIPRPGARSAPASPPPAPQHQAAQEPPAAPQAHYQAPPQPHDQAPPPQPAPSAPSNPPPQALQLEGGINPLVTGASTLLAVMNRLRNSLEPVDAAALQRQLAFELRQFENHTKSIGIKPELVITARYLLCTALDETVMNTPWGATAGWSQHSLLSLFHNETFGGEKFFAILDRLLETPAQTIDVLELVYLLLSQGFEGKYRVVARGRDQLEIISDNLYRTIEQQRGGFEPDLSPQWRSTVRRDKSLMQYLPLWVVTSCVLAGLLLCYSGYRLWLYQSTQPTTTHLQTVLEQSTAADRAYSMPR